MPRKCSVETEPRGLSIDLKSLIALDIYETSIRKTVRSWLGKIASADGQPLNTSLFGCLIAFDNMGRVGFSKDLGTVTAGTEDRRLEMLGIYFKSMAMIGQLVWPMGIAMRLPLGGVMKEMDDFGIGMVEQRERVCYVTQALHRLRNILTLEPRQLGDQYDIMKFLLEDYEAEKPKSIFNRTALLGDSMVILVAAAYSYFWYSPYVRTALIKL